MSHQFTISNNFINKIKLNSIITKLTKGVMQPYEKEESLKHDFSLNY